MRKGSHRQGPHEDQWSEWSGTVPYTQKTGGYRAKHPREGWEEKIQWLREGEKEEKEGRGTGRAKMGGGR